MSLLFPRVSGHAFEAGDRRFAGAGRGKAGRWPPAEPPLPPEHPLLPSLQHGWASHHETSGAGRGRGRVLLKKGISVILLEELSLDLLPSGLSTWQMWREVRGLWAIQAPRCFSSWYDEGLTALCIHPCLQFSIKKLAYKGLLMHLLILHECFQPWHTNFSSSLLTIPKESLLNWCCQVGQDQPLFLCQGVSSWFQLP